MRVVLVLADDPAVDDGGLRRSVEAALASAYHDVDVIDLHAGDFNPAMTAAGRRAYHSGEPLVEPDVADFGPRVSAAEALVFVYRASWTGMPPRLKGFVDRTFVPGVGFHLTDGKLQRGLVGVRRLTAIAIHDRSRSEVLRSRDYGRRILLRTMRLIVNRRCRRRYVALYDTRPERAAAARRRFSAKLDRVLVGL
ncbi:MAG: NAD(P)H-dependent oxidoreductase [bacterium]|nr:NAD(P)H-dependent oxidoreductase [bacterium]